MENDAAYLLTWLDTVITKTLNPHTTNVQQLSGIQAKQLADMAIKETDRLLTILHNGLLSVQDNKEARLLARRYHTAFSYLVNRENENNKHIEFKAESLQDLHRILSGCLETLLDFLETRFGTYLSSAATVSPHYIAGKKEVLVKIIKQASERLIPPVCEKALSELLLQVFTEFTDNVQAKKGVTYREIKYMQRLVSELGQLAETKRLTETCTITDELLIRLNFNHGRYIRYFIGRLNDRLNASESLTEKLDMLLYYFKSFSELYRVRHLAYDKNTKSLHAVISRWFRREIRYIRRKISLPLPIGGNEVKQIRKTTSGEYTKQKITCQLSADQMALILRSLDDLRIINARSLSDVFRTIVPYLSTQNKQELSFEAMRSKSYNAEAKDLERVTEVLTEMIKKINGY